MDIALVGIGKIALDQHVPAINASDDWQLAATVSRAGQVEGVPGFDDFETFLAQRPDIRVVSLCLPPVPRFDYAASAIRAGRHVMLEKPPGATLAECHALEALARKHRVSLYATWHSREAEMVAPAKAWLAERDLISLEVIWKEDVRRWHPGQDWVFDPGGMGVFDPGINALSIVTEILPDPIHLRNARLEVPQNKQTPIAANLTFAHPKGASVTAQFDWRQTGPQTWDIKAKTSDGTLHLSEGGSKMTINGKEKDTNKDTLKGEYPRLYGNMMKLLKREQIDMDLSPLVHVCDAFTLGERSLVEAFAF